MNKKDISEYLAELGRKGGKKRAESLTPEKRSAIAKKAAAARWPKVKPEAPTKAKKKAAREHYSKREVR